MKKIFLAIFSLTLIAFVFPQETLAKRTLPQAAGYKATTTSKTRGIGVSVKFRSDRRAIVVNFSSLDIANSVSYSLSYQSRGVQQGVGGTINSQGGVSQTREIIFGTCSAGICRYDTGLTNAKFSVTSTLKNGLKILRSFRLKV